ncbi:hypothetical protein ACN28I_27280 [Archangium gephyra]|uniref:hypothetical protein n=1 Tax=Archangium gephyra TaxID=48 RepID=UPI003B7B66AB
MVGTESVEVERRGRLEMEGGPLIVADRHLLGSWRGVEGDGADYRRACDFFDQFPEVEGGTIPMRSGAALLWEMRGGGTADVFVLPGPEVLVVRTWQHDPLDEETPGELATTSADETMLIGELTVTAGSLGVLWAAEEGALVGKVGVEVKLPNGTYVCRHELTHGRGGHARRLRISPS